MTLAKTVKLGRRSASRFLNRYLKTEADRLIWQSAMENRGLILANFATGIVGAMFEGGTFGIIFLAVTLLSTPQGIDWNQYAILAGVPGLGSWLNALGQEILFILLFKLLTYKKWGIHPKIQAEWKMACLSCHVRLTIIIKWLS